MQSKNDKPNMENELTKMLGSGLNTVGELKSKLDKISRRFGNDAFIEVVGLGKFKVKLTPKNKDHHCTPCRGTGKTKVGEISKGQPHKEKIVDCRWCRGRGKMSHEKHEEFVARFSRS